MTPSRWKYRTLRYSKNGEWWGVSDLVEEINNAELCQATLSREFTCSFDSDKEILSSITEFLINSNQKLLWVCLGHQAICKQKWFEVKKQSEVTQWLVKDVFIDDKKYKLGFYNSFSPVAKDDFT